MNYLLRISEHDMIRSSITLTLVDLIERSITPFEKLDKSRFMQGQVASPDEFESAINGWRRLLSTDESSKIKWSRYLEYSNLSEQDLHQMLAPARFRDQDKLPQWSVILEQILSKPMEPVATRASEESDEDLIPFEELTLPLVELFFEALSKEMSFDWGKSLSFVAIDKIKEYLKRRCAKLWSAVLFDEFCDYRKGRNPNGNQHYLNFINGLLKDNFLGIFGNYPVLARLIATEMMYQLKFLSDFLLRWHRDKEEILSHFQQSVDDSITDLEFTLSDAHNEGQSVIILTLSHGFKLVYKPRCVKITAAYNQFCKWVNTSLSPQIKVVDLIAKDNYGWIEFIPHRSCQNESEIRAYYERAGILLGITYFLESTDYHAENLIANGAHPVLIDHETIIQPYFDLRNSSNKCINQVEGVALDSVLRSFLLPFKNRVLDLRNNCGFGTVKEKDLFIIEKGYKNTNTDRMKQSTKYVKYCFSKNLPKLNGEVKRMGNYQEELVGGFKKVHRMIRENQSLLLSASGPLRFFQSFPIRLIFRSTHVYTSILERLLIPKYLKNANSYGQCIELLAKAFVVDGKKPIFWDLLREERIGLLKRDVPCFSFQSNSRKIYWDGQDGSIGKFLGLDCLTSIKRKISRVDEEDLKQQIAIIRKVIKIQQ